MLNSINIILVDLRPLRPEKCVESVTDKKDFQISEILKSFFLFKLGRPIMHLSIEYILHNMARLSHGHKNNNKTIKGQAISIYSYINHYDPFSL